MTTTRIPGQPESYHGRYQTSTTAIGWVAPCPACGQDVPWTASSTTAAAPICDCPTDTGTGVVTGKGTAPVPAPTCQETNA